MKYLSLLVAACLLLTALFTGCGSSTEAPAQTTMETTTEVMQGYTISEVQDAIVEMLKREDPDYVTPYMLPGAERAVDYAKQNQMDWADANLEGERYITGSPTVFFAVCNDIGIRFDASMEYDMEDSILLSEAIVAMPEDSPTYESSLSYIKEMEQCLAIIGYDDLMDVASFRVWVNDAEVCEVYATFVSTGNGWFVLSLECEFETIYINAQN